MKDDLASEVLKGKSAPPTNKASGALLRSVSKRRLIIGPPAKSKGGGTNAGMIRFDTDADAGAPADKRLGQVHEITDDRAKLLRTDFKGLAERLGLQVR